MQHSSNIVSLAAARRAKGVLPPPVLSYASLSYAIDRVAHHHVSFGAVVLLRLIALYLETQENELSYTFLCAELRTTDKTLTKYIDELEDAALLRVRRSRIRHRENAVNQFEIDFNGPLGDPMATLKMPKNPNKRGTGIITVPTQGVPEKLRCNIYIHSKDKVPKGTRRSAPEFGTVSEALEATTKRIVRKRAEKVEKATKSQVLTLAGVKATWATAMLRHYPTVPPVAFTAKEFAILKAKLVPLLATANMSDVFDFFVSSWSTLRETKFKWLRAKGNDVAPAPSLPELMRYWKVFVQAYADSRMVEATGTARTSVSRETALEIELAQAKAQAAKETADRRKLEEKLAATERIAYSKGTAPRLRDTRTLSERKAALDDDYNGPDTLPEWK